MISVVDTVQHQQSCSKPKPGSANDGWTDANTEQFFSQLLLHYRPDTVCEHDPVLGLGGRGPDPGNEISVMYLVVITPPTVQRILMAESLQREKMNIY